MRVFDYAGSDLNIYSGWGLNRASGAMEAMATAVFGGANRAAPQAY